jgi:hypothetical protein
MIIATAASPNSPKTFSSFGDKAQEDISEQTKATRLARPLLMYKWAMSQALKKLRQVESTSMQLKFTLSSVIFDLMITELCGTG